MIDNFIPLFSSFLNSGIWNWFLPILCLCFIATVPYIIRYIIRWRS